ncbi:MAG TPA: SpaA isopeptide-forming pilin-related protein, partial [Thermomicrobiales bacterium]|nr:SpaA isopeptide-forming pilin-related protein [Thermomicrobiales bacterium]
TPTVSAQQQDNTPPPFPAPSSVSVIGNFQAALGCPADNDPTCTITSLQLDDFGVWSGTFTIPPGSYSYRIVANADQQRSLGEDADPNGNDIDLDVPDDSTGTFFSYNQRTGEIYAASISQLTELQTDFGTQPMFPEKDGDKFFAIVDGDPGTAFTAQVLVNGEPTGDPGQFTIGSGSRIRITSNANGRLDSKDIEPVVLNITKTDDQGNALTGSCFSVYDGDKVAGQACDTDDGEDGVTQIRFSLGVGNGLQLAESSTPDGQPVAEPQDIDLGPGVNNITVTAGGGGGIRTTDTPTDVNVSLQMQDDDGNPIVGGCLQLGDLGEQCDDDSDGTITFENVPANQSYDLTETQAPDGFEPFAGGTVDVGDSDMQYPVPHAAVGGGVGNLTLYTVDENGNPVPNVCYDITGVDGVQCDEDGDGDMGLTELPAGQYGAKQNSVPDGYTLDEQEQSVVVEGGAEAQLTFTSPTAQAQTFQVTIQASDDQGNAAGGACYAVLDSNGNQVADACDDGSGSGASFTLPNGDYALTVTSVPDGYTTPDNVSFSVQDADTSVSVTLPIVVPEETATEVPAEETPTETVEAASDTGTINITVTDADGFAIIGACVQIEGASSGEICDNGDGDGNSEDGFIQVQNLPDGDYTVSVSQLPEGFDPAQPVSVTIADGGAVDAQLVSGVTEPTETPA